MTDMTHDELVERLKYNAEMFTGASLERRLFSEAAARITGLEATLKEIARQPLIKDIDGEDLEWASFEDGYEHCVLIARAALGGKDE